MLWVVACEMFLSVNAQIYRTCHFVVVAAAADCHDFVVDNVQHREFVIFDGV